MTDQDQARIQSVVAAAIELKSLKESCDGMLSDLMRDAFTFDREDGVQSSQMGQFSFQTGYSQALHRPCATNAVYQVEMHRHILQAISRSFAARNPYWKGFEHNVKSYVVCDGMRISVTSSDPDKAVDKGVARRVKDEIDNFNKLNGYRQVQFERATRPERDGEFTLVFNRDADDGVLRVEFIEPRQIENPPGRSNAQNCWFGVQYRGWSYSPEAVQGIYARPMDYLGAPIGEHVFIKRGDYIRRTANVDRNSPRGLPTPFCVMPSLEQAQKTLRAMGKLVHYREKVALISKVRNAISATVQPLLSPNTAGGDDQFSSYRFTINDLPEGAAIRTSDAIDYEFPSQNIETDKIYASVVADLRAVSSAVGFAEYMLSADTGKSNYASLMAVEGPPNRTFRMMQADMVEDDQIVYAEALKMAVEHGRLEQADVDGVKLQIEPPALNVRDRVQDSQAANVYIQAGAMAPREAAMQDGRDYDVTQQYLKQDGPPPMLQQSGQQEGSMKTTARPFGKNEPGTKVNPKVTEAMVESAHDDRGDVKPTTEDLAMAARIITPEWLALTKSTLLMLPQLRHMEGVLGTVDDQRVVGTDMDAMTVKHHAPDLVVAGNSERWSFVPADEIWVDSRYDRVGDAHIALHEIIEQKLMRAGWSYARAHRYANNGPGCEMDWLLVLRPGLKVYAD